MEGENCANAWGVHMRSYNSVPTATESLKILIHVTDNRSWKFFFGCYLLHTECVPIHVQVTEGDFQYTKSSIVYIHWWLIHSCELSWRKEWTMMFHRDVLHGMGGTLPTPMVCIFGALTLYLLGYGAVLLPETSSKSGFRYVFRGTF